MQASLLAGFLSIVTDLKCLILVFICVGVGIIFGAIPGLTATTAIAMFLPVTYALDTKTAIAILVALYIDKSSRLAATMDVYKYMKIAGDYEKDDIVEGIIYEIKEGLGAFVAVDGEYAAMIPEKEIHEKLRVGQRITARVTNVREDGKINLSIRQKAYEQMDKDAEAVLRVIQEYDGVLPYNDKASPQLIERDFHMSKAAFKRAVGRLYRERKIEIRENGIRLTEN